MSGLSKVLVRKKIRIIHAKISNEKEWLSVLTSISTVGCSIPHFFIFKEKRKLKDYVTLCTTVTIMAMQEKRYMNF